MNNQKLPEKTVPLWKELLHPAVIVGALGYFVDVYDVSLFMTIRKVSLTSLGLGHLISGAAWYQDLLSWQVVGMLAGGIFFGIIGDRMGRLTTLFGSILLYSIANIANGLVHSFEAYAAWRFIAGFGLAGELGGCIALVSETLSKERRGYGTALVATAGVLGAVASGFMADHVAAVGVFVGRFFDGPIEGWRMSYFIGGGLGLLLLVLRVSVRESGMFERAREHAAKGSVGRGNFFALFTDRRRFGRYFLCTLIGLPNWFIIGILVQRATTIFAPASHITGVPIKENLCVAVYSLGLTGGDLASGIASQLLRSRKKVLLGFLLFGFVCVAIFLFGAHGWSSDAYYFLIFLMGLGMGCWALFVTIAAELFGTNLRATVATTVPNFSRASLVPVTILFTFLAMPLDQPRFTPAVASAIVGIICFGAAFYAVASLDETFGKDLDYQEKE